jgi:hypothetical protein
MYIDPHYLILRQNDLEKLFQFEAVLPSAPFPVRHRVDTSSILATTQHYEPLLKLLDPKFLSSIDFYAEKAG